MKKAWILLYALALLGDVIGLLAENAALHVFCKPLLTPLLIWGIWQHKSMINGTYWAWVVAGLFCSWAGDIFLLYEKKVPIFFMLGLGSFLVAHVCYIIYYVKNGASLSGAWRKNKWWLMLALVYAAALITMLFPTLGTLRIPVIIYSLVLISMLLGAVALIGAVPKAAIWFFVIGAVAFVISDSSLAINKFYHPFPLSGVIIMMTYGIAQWLIVTGAILNDGRGKQQSETI